MLKGIHDYHKAVDLTVKIGGLNARIQDWLFQPTLTTGRDSQLAILAGELQDRADDLYQLLNLKP